MRTPDVYIDDVLNDNVLKTGDIILFKSYNNFNSILTSSYFGHVGIVYCESSVPLLFEANITNNQPLKPHHNKAGIYLSPLEDRIKKYKGRCWLKPLNKELSPDAIKGFREFIDYALTNMHYEHAIASSALRKWLRLARCSNNTNCAELTFLSLIKLGLLPIEEYDKHMLHYLKYVARLENLSNGYKYLPLIGFIDHPFKN